jgi:hypothetical protein
MHIPEFPRMAVTWDLEKSAFMIWEKQINWPRIMMKAVVFLE